MHSKNQIYYLSGFLISVIGIILSVILICKHGFPNICTGSMGCSIEGVDGCKELGESEYSKIFGIPIAYFGIIFYSFLAFLFGYSFLKEKPEHPEINHSRILLLFYASIFGVIFDSFLGYINFTKLIVPCLLCVYTYFVTLAIFILSLVLKNRNKPQIYIRKIFNQGLINLGSAIIFATLVVGVFYAFENTQATSQTKSVLLPSDKVKDYLNDFYALKEYSLSTKDLKTYEGSLDGYIVIHKFADFLCPHCYDTAQLLQKALQRWPGRILVYYRQFPLDSTCNKDLTSPPRKPYGDWRCNGALAAVCAGDYPQFAEFYHQIFALQDQQLPIDLEQLQRISKNLDIPWNKLFMCMTSPFAQQKINRDVEDARIVGINSTPTVLVNNRLVSRGTPDETYFFYLLDALVYEKEGESAYQEFNERMKKQGK
ncbi:MAG: thioredoxin domain-containing protein [Leptospiraceae bacterium]|nr:thioredoxin domain-containing protein [Leptospiraceae bacterium]MDW7976912.1 vitamin K epoxide reductase family protein [Leptospiraceae bacterium]